jgi:hypothetical protein
MQLIQEQNTQTPTQNRRKDVYTIVGREDTKPYWLKIGVAFDNRDGSINIKLNALPVNGILHVREANIESKLADS